MQQEKITNNVIISFFFNTRGELWERTTKEVWAGLEAQLLTYIPALQIVLNIVALPFDMDDTTWTEGIVVGISKTAVQILVSRRLTCFVDTLDRCRENSIRNMVNVLQDMGEEAMEHSYKFLVSFSSRHSPTFTAPYGLPKSLEQETEHAQDIARYIAKRLNTAESALARTAKSHFIGKANGIFLWVVVLVYIPNKVFQRGRMHDVQQKLEELLPELSNLFEDILTRDSTNGTYCLVI
jgi:hypothetical protein